MSIDGVHVCHPTTIIEYAGSEDEGSESSPQSLVECRDSEEDEPECSSQAAVEDESTEAVVFDCKCPYSLLQRRARPLSELHLALPNSTGSTLVNPLSHRAGVRAVADRPRSEDGDYEPIKQIGIDGEGVIDLVRSRSARQLVVRKTVEYARLAYGKPIEAAILQDIFPEGHNNIIRLQAFELYQLEGARYYFEYCSGGDLHQLVDQYSKHGGLLPEPFIWQTYQKLASALEFLHRGFDPRCPDKERRGICHRDIKPSNIFLRLDPTNPGSGYPEIVLADFGHATLDFATYDPAGTTLWQPPELPRHSPKGDVYSLGAVMHFLIHFKAPIAERPEEYYDTESLKNAWAAAPETRQPMMEFVDEYSEELICMMLIALEPDENRRKNSSQLLKCVSDCVDVAFPPGSDSMRKATEEWPMASWAYDEIWSARGRDDGEEEDEDEGPGTKQYFEMMDVFGCVVSRESSLSSLHGLAD